MTIKSFRDILYSYEKTNPKLALQDPTTSNTRYIPAASILSTSIVDIPVNDTYIPVMLLISVLKTDRFIPVSLSDILSYTNKINTFLDDTNFVFLVDGELLDIGGLRFDCLSNTLIFYYSAIEI